MIGARKAAVTVDLVAPAREVRDNAAAALATAERTVAELEAAKTMLPLDDVAIAVHVTKVQIAQSRVEIARRLHGEADAALAQSEVEAEAARKEAVFADAVSARDAAVAVVRDRYPALVAATAQLRATIAAADAKVAEANRARIAGKPHLYSTEETVFDMAPLGEKHVGTDEIEKFVYLDNGTVVPTGRPIRDRGDGVMFDMTPMGNFGGPQGREVRKVKFSVERYFPGRNLVVGPRIPTLSPVPEYAPQSEQESTRETRVFVPSPGSNQPRLQAVRTPGLDQRASA